MAYSRNVPGENRQGVSRMYTDAMACEANTSSTYDPLPSDFDTQLCTRSATYSGTAFTDSFTAYRRTLADHRNSEAEYGNTEYAVFNRDDELIASIIAPLSEPNEPRFMPFVSWLTWFDRVLSDETAS